MTDKAKKSTMKALRLPNDLKNKLDAMAKKEHRNLTAQIIFLLEAATEEENQTNTEEEK